MAQSGAACVNQNLITPLIPSVSHIWYIWHIRLDQTHIYGSLDSDNNPLLSHCSLTVPTLDTADLINFRTL